MNSPNRGEVWLVLILFLTADIISQSDKAFAQERVPQFADYPSRVIRTSRSIPVDIGSTPYTSCFRTMLRDTARRGAEFAGHYALSYWGCGSECARIGIVDLRTGRSYVSSFFVSPVSFKTRPDSRLIVINDPAEVAKEFGGDTADLPDRFQPEYFLWTGQKLLLIAKGKIGREPQPDFYPCKGK
jgi:hypothetical protein